MLGILTNSKKVIASARENISTLESELSVIREELNQTRIDNERLSTELE